MMMNDSGEVVGIDSPGLLARAIEATPATQSIDPDELAKLIPSLHFIGELFAGGAIGLGPGRHL